MKKLLILIPVFLLNCSSITDVTPDETFVKYFGDNAFFEVRDMIKVTPNGEDEEIVILARRLGEYIPNPDLPDQVFLDVARFYVVHLSSEGEVLHESIIPFDLPDLNNLTQPSRITALDGGGYLVIGTHALDFGGGESDPKYIAWAELDADFVPVGTWNQIGDGVDNYIGVDIAGTSDGGVLLAGYTDKNGDNDYFYKKVGGTGEWERTQARVSSDDQLVRALALSNGNYALVGRTDALSDDGEGGINVERTIIDSEGIIQNSAVYGMSVDGGTIKDDIPLDVLERPGGFTIVGASDSHPFLMNVDLVGAASTEVLYRDDLDGTADGLNTDLVTGSAASVTRMATNDLMVVGQVDGFTDTQDDRALNDNGREIMIFTTDQAGNRISDIRQYGLVNGNESAVRVLSLSDGQVMIAGNFQFGDVIQQIAILKTNTKGLLKQ